MSGIVSGLIGGAIAIVVTAYVANRVGRTGAEGQLRFGGFLWGLGACCLALAALPVVATFQGNDRDFWAKLGLFVGFGFGGMYCLVEAGLVRGRFDSEGIAFFTPWTGQKRELWRDLVSVEPNDWCNWYTLTFKSGKRIRLSKYLGGHISALEAAARSHER